MANLITLEDYKTSEKIESTKDDTRLDSLIASVSSLVKTYCNNPLVDYYSTDKTETISVKWSTTSLQLAGSPIVSVTSVKERTSYDSAYTTLTTGAHEYYLDLDTDSIVRTTGSTFKNWPQGPGSVQVAYRSGYVTCPADLQLAVIDLINYYHKDEHKARQTMQGASIQNTTSSSQANNVSFPDHIKRVLDLYKNY
jgi:hypothetical protein